jgi:hypothetical protein
MNTLLRSALSLTDILKAGRNHLATLLDLLEVKTRKATEIEKLAIDAIKTMISALESQLKKRD